MDLIASLLHKKAPLRFVFIVSSQSAKESTQNVVLEGLIPALLTNP